MDGGNQFGQLGHLWRAYSDGLVEGGRPVLDPRGQELEDQQAGSAVELDLGLEAWNLPGVHGAPVQLSVVGRGGVERADPCGMDTRG